MNISQLSALRLLHNNFPEKHVHCVIKGRYQFIGDLNDLDLSSTISVLIMNSALKESITDAIISRFDVVMWFDGGEFWTGENVLAKLDSLRFPDLENIMQEICTIVGKCSEMRIVALEEQFVRFAADTRIRFGIPGPTPKDVAPYTDKMQMKDLASGKGIRTAKYQVVDLNDLLNDETKLNKLEQNIPYPIFLKPTNGVGAAGTKRAENRNDLVQWIKSGHTESNISYLAEEFIEALQELTVLGFCQNGKLHLFATIVHCSPPVYEYLTYGRPMVRWASVDQNEEINSFIKNVADVFVPLEGSVFVVQLFETSTGFVLNELACRVPGVIGSSMLYFNIGLNPESMQMMGQIKTLNLQEVQKPVEHFGMVVYPKRATEKCKLIEPELDKITSRVVVKWAVKDGQRLGNATNIGDVIVRLFIWNLDYKQLKQDLRYLEKHYDPLTP